MTKYIVTSKDPGKNTGGNKAKEDIINIAVKHCGFKQFNLYVYPNKIRRFLYVKSLKRKIREDKAECFVLQYPVISSFVEDNFINYVKNTNAKLYFFIHDLPALQNLNAGEEAKEIARLNKADGLIVHNEQMKRWLGKHGVKKDMIILEIFDYLNPQKLQEFEKYEGTVCFPGNLAKSTFLNNLKLKSHKLDIYGPNFEELNINSKSIEYKGQYSPEQLPKHLSDNFGLIWDGISSQGCQGRFGEYLMYNNPHKASLYISSGIPVIIWEKAALAKFIKQYDLGITISNLNDLDKVLDNVTVEQYGQLKRNVNKIAEKLRAGEFTINALSSL